MGASLDYRIYPGSMTKEKIQDAWYSDVEDSLIQDGNSYSGAIGMLGRSIVSWQDLSFDSEAKAEDWLSEHHEKWEHAIAVSFMRVKHTAESEVRYKAAFSKVETKLAKAAQAYQTTLDNIAKSFFKQKSFYCTCPSCKSKINRSKLRSNIPSVYELQQPYYKNTTYKGITCPVCGTGLYTERAYKRIGSDYAKLWKHVLAVSEFEFKDKGMTYEKYWIVGGWCSS